MNSKSKYKAISFDWDGVITIRGEILKQLAWDNLAKKENSDFAAVLQKHRIESVGEKNSRYDILRETFLDLEIPGNLIDGKVREYAEKYQTEVMNLMVSDIRPGAGEVLENLTKRSHLYVNSATAEDGLRLSAKSFGLANFFREIYGYPTDGIYRGKAEVLRLIMKEEGTSNPKDILHIGDGDGDLRGVRETGVDFVAFSNADNNWVEKDVAGYPIIRNLAELDKLI